MTVCGVILCSASAAANVIDFCTEPGSNADITGGSIGTFGLMVFGSAASNVPLAASAITCPVCASRIAISASLRARTRRRPGRGSAAR